MMVSTKKILANNHRWAKLLRSLTVNSLKEAQKNVNCYFVNTVNCLKESNGYFVTVKNWFKKILLVKLL